MTRDNAHPIHRLAILFFLITLLSACEESTDLYPKNPNNPDGGGNGGTTVTIVQDEALGTILADGQGNTLYVFTPDVAGQTTCVDDCLNNWPAFTGDTLSVEGARLRDEDFASITRPDGTEQFTYQGYPLYFFAGDQQPGDANGEGVGEVWFVAKPDYSVLAGTQEVADLGQVTYLTDEQGNSLYYFANDEADVSNCVDGCLDNWPAFLVDDVVAPSLLNQDDFATITRDDSEEQVTYRGRPLYFFAGDSQRGDTNGQGVGDVWSVADMSAEALVAAPPAPDAENELVVTVAQDDALGTILVDEEGNTLYLFTPDVAGEATCTDGCSDNWPAFQGSQLNVDTDEGLLTDDFGVITLADGSFHFTYQGYPLYFFAGDQQPGDTNGEGVGEVWFVAKPDYSVFVGTQEVADLGQVSYLTDGTGNTLYYFANDAANESTCVDGCLDNWPAFLVDDVVAPSLLSQDEFATITRPDGAEQVTYRERPLYFFAGDNQRGDTNGQGVGDVWSVANITAEAWTTSGDGGTPEEGYEYGG